MPTFIPIERDPNAEVKQAFVYNEDFNINTPEFDDLSAAQKQIIENFINENTTNGNFLAPGTIISFNFDAAEPVWDASNGLKLNEDGQIVRRPTNSEWFVSVDDDGSIRLVEKEESGNVQYDGENFGWTIGENDNSLDGYLIGGEKVSKLIKEAEDNDETLGDYLKKQTNLSEEELADKTEDLNLNMKLIEEKYEEEQAQRDIAKAAAERDEASADEDPDEVSAESVNPNLDDGLDGGLEDDFPDSDEAADVRGKASADELESEPEQKPESESKQEPQPVELTEEQTEQPEEQAKKKLWDTLKEAFSKFTIRSKTKKDVKAEIVESQNQGLKPVSEEKVSEEKQLTPAERIKVDACTAIMMAHLENHSINYTPETVKNIVQNALTTYAAALGSDRLLGGFRDASTTKRLISDVMSGITTDIQKEFGEQPIKVTVTASLGREEMRTIAKQMYSVLKIPNDDDHLGNSIRTTLDEIPNIKVPLTVSYMEALEERKKHETIIENNNTYISDLKKAIEDQKTSLNDIKEKFKAETGLDYDKITASKAPDAPDTNDIPDYSKILKPEYSELFEQCVFLSSNLNRLNTDLEDQNKADLPDIKDDDKKIRDMEEQLQKLGVSGITEFINKLNPIAVPSGEPPAPENPYISGLGENFDNKKPAPVDVPADATPSDPTPESDATLEPESKAQDQNNGEPTASTTETLTDDTETAPEAHNDDSELNDQTSASTAESANPADPEPGTTPAADKGQDGAATEQHEGNDNAQGEKESTDSDDLESASAATPESDATIEPESKAQDQNNGEPTAADAEKNTGATPEFASDETSDEKRDATPAAQNENKEEPTASTAENHTNSRKTAFNGACTANMNGTDSKVATEEEAARQAAASTETDAATTVEVQGNGSHRKGGGYGYGGHK